MKRIHFMLMPALGATLATLAGACTLVGDFELSQCKSTADCTKKGAAFAAYTCENNVCVAPTVETECETKAECVELLETPDAVCNMGVCEDPVWGCLFDETTPPPPVSNFTFQANLVSLAFEPIPGAQVRACTASTPTACSGRVFAGPTAPNASTGAFTLKFDAGARGFDGLIRVEAPEYIPLEFHMLQTQRMNVTLPANLPLIMLKVNTIKGFGALGSPPIAIDEENQAMITMRFYDCQDRPAPGLFIQAPDSPESFFFSATESFAPDVDATGTSADGIGGVINMRPSLQDLIVVDTKSGRTLWTFSIWMHANTTLLAYVHANEW